MLRRLPHGFETANAVSFFYNTECFLSFTPTFKIFNWLIKGYDMWKKEGLGDEPAAIIDANAEYRFDMDSVGSFVTDCLEIDAIMKWRLNNTVLYNTYLKWCTKNNERANSQNWLSMRMQEKVFKRMITNSQRVWVGLVLRDEWKA